MLQFRRRSIRPAPHIPDITEEAIRAVMIPPCKREMLYELMNVFHESCKKFDITYWAVGGTLLGAVREKGIILWDDDLDITVLESQRDRVEAMLAYIVSILPNSIYNNFIWDSSNKGWKLGYYPRPGMNVDLDIFISDRFADKALSSTPYFYNSSINPRRRNRFPADLFIESDLFLPDGKLKEVPFGRNTIVIPANPIPYLNRKYKDWDTIIHVFNHSTHHGGRTIKYRYTSEMLNNILDLCSRDRGSSS